MMRQPKRSIEAVSFTCKTELTGISKTETRIHGTWMKVRAVNGSSIVEDGGVHLPNEEWLSERRLENDR